MSETKDIDVTALGELLIDFTQYGLSDRGNITYEANPGGAPCNVLSMLSKLGKKTSFIGKVGGDQFGRQLRHAILEQGIDAGGLSVASDVPTTLAFVHNLADGDREFSFYRKPGADTSLMAGDVPAELIEHSRIFHFGSLSLTDEPVRSATVYAVLVAKDTGCRISFDPNLREILWESAELAKEQIGFGMAHCDILKIADNELRWYTSEEDLDRGIVMILNRYPGIRLVCLSMGADGSRAYYRNGDGQAARNNTASIPEAAGVAPSGENAAKESISDAVAALADNGKETVVAASECGETASAALADNGKEPVAAAASGSAADPGCGSAARGERAKRDASPEILRVTVPAFIRKDTIDTTGAGDTFWGCVLNYLLDHDPDHLTEAQLREMLTFANAAASIITARKGALRVMPAREEIEAVIRGEADAR